MCVVYREGHFDATKLLLNHGVECNMPSGSNDDTPLTLACWKGHSNIAMKRVMSCCQGNGVFTVHYAVKAI